MVSAIVHRGAAVAIVEEEFARNGLERSAGQRLGDVGHAVFDRDARAAEQVFHIGCDSDARIFDQLECFGEDAFDQRLVEQFKFWSHNVSGISTSHLGTDPLVRSAKRSERGPADNLPGGCVRGYTTFPEPMGSGLRGPVF